MRVSHLLLSLVVASGLATAAVVSPIQDAPESATDATSTKHASPMAVAPVSVAHEVAQPDEDTAAILAGTLAPIAVFEIRGGGALFHLEGGASAGNKAFKNKVNVKSIAQCLDGGLGCASHFDADELSADGKAYVYIYDATTWGLTTTPDPNDTVGGPIAEGNPVPVTVLRGLMDGKGRFMFSGTHVPSDTDLVVEGKAGLEKGTLTPKKMGGKISAVSIEAEHWAKANFKTFGKSLLIN